MANTDKDTKTSNHQLIKQLSECNMVLNLIDNKELFLHFSDPYINIDFKYRLIDNVIDEDYLTPFVESIKKDMKKRIEMINNILKQSL